MHFTAKDIAAATGGELIGPDVTVTSAAIDSRVLTPGQLFVPIVAERDGHDFIAAALTAGATAYFTSRDVEPRDDVAAIRVADTAAALAALGRAGRRRLPGRVVGVTGSVGKTSTKDLIAGALQTTYRTTASEKSFNNELGLPLTVLGAPDDTEALVLEMGARGVGHIATLCDIAEPDVGVLTRVEEVHLETFGTIENIAATKGELIAALPADGVAVLNADDPNVAAMGRRTTARTLTYGFGSGVDLTASDVVLDEQLRASFTMHTPWGSTAVRLGARGEHQVPNALAAAGAAGGLGVDVEQIAAGLAAAALSGLRMELVTAANGLTVINDAYNANPTSMAAALRSLARYGAARRVAVLGTMAELGTDADAAHAAMTSLARELGIDVIAVHESSYGPGAQHVETVEEAAEQLAGLGEADAVLVKGSRMAALERVVALLQA